MRKILFITIVILLSWTTSFAATFTKGLIGREDIHYWDGLSGDSKYNGTTSTGFSITLKDVGTEVNLLDAYGGNVNWNGTTISSAVLEIGRNNNVALVFDPGVWTVDTGITIYRNFILRFPSGASLYPMAGVTIWIAGPIDAGNYPIFDLSAGSGATVILIDRALEGIVYDRWFGDTENIGIGKKPGAYKVDIAGNLRADSFTGTVPFSSLTGSAGDLVANTVLAGTSPFYEYSGTTATPLMLAGGLIYYWDTSTGGVTLPAISSNTPFTVFKVMTNAGVTVFAEHKDSNHQRFHDNGSFGNRIWIPPNNLGAQLSFHAVDTVSPTSGASKFWDILGKINNNWVLSQ